MTFVCNYLNLNFSQFQFEFHSCGLFEFHFAQVIIRMFISRMQHRFFDIA
jgi:hypothetical protein